MRKYSIIILVVIAFVALLHYGTVGEVCKRDEIIKTASQVINLIKHRYEMDNENLFQFFLISSNIPR